LGTISVAPSQLKRFVIFEGVNMLDNIIEFPKMSLNIKEFEEGNDLTEDNYFQEYVRSGTFNLSDGTEYGYHFHPALSIFKTHGKPLPKTHLD